ncbi:MAG: phosphomannomutase/phosphoglucomutase [Gammaproteobacteria bacterium]|nr:phosphomannomutase/phosphoglucomutase [Gammaproteobacteria bacterium]
MEVGFNLKSLKSGSVVPIVAGLLVLAALWMAWSGWQRFASSRLEAASIEARTQVAEAVKPIVGDLLDRAGKLRGRVALINALRAADTAAATALVKEAVPGTEAVEFYSSDFNRGYTDPEAFGYGKLGLLERALQDDKAVLAVVKDSGSPRLAVAVPVMFENQVLRVAYLRQPLAPLLAVAKDAAPSGAYLAVRQGGYNVVESGVTEELKFRAEEAAVAVDRTELRVVAAAPPVNPGLFGLHGMGEFGIALLLGGLAAAALLLSRRREAQRADSPVLAAKPVDMTLAEMQSAGHIVAPEASKAVRTTSETAAAPGIALDRSIFRAYDIRGVVGQTLDANIARLIGQAIGSVMHERNQRSIVIGRDGRLSSPTMAGALIEGLRKAGREVIDIGEVPTPMAYFGSFHLRTGCCVSVTGSHNPPDYNGFKIVVDGETLSGDAIQNIYVRIAENRLFRADSLGLLSIRDLKNDYLDRISGDIQIERKLKVVIDCGSGVAGGIAPDLLTAIGADVEPLYCEVDGTFPHHHPDPSDPANLQDLISVVQRTNADIGLALDGDGDRLGVVTKSGEIIYPDRLLMLFAADVLERNPGACVIYDVKCTGHLATHILRHGGSPLMWKTGHSLIKAKMKETEAELAGEMSGHFFFRERWYGFDDGLYAAARLLEILAASPDDAEILFAELPKGVSTPELKINVEEGEQYRFIEEFVAKAKFDGARIATIDGLRADWPDGWGLVRASNTTPCLVLRFDAKDNESLHRVQAAFREQILAISPGLALPF